MNLTNLSNQPNRTWLKERRSLCLDLETFSSDLEMPERDVTPKLEKNSILQPVTLLDSQLPRLSRKRQTLKIVGGRNFL